MDKNEFDLWLAQLGFIPEVMFKGLSGKRRWRFDYSHYGTKTAIEYHGLGQGRGTGQRKDGTLYDLSTARGGHETVSGLNRDAAKLTEASIEGWTVIVCTRDTIKDGQCQNWVEEAMRRAA